MQKVYGDKIMIYGALLNLLIRQEIAGIGYEFLENDKQVLKNLCDEINSTLNIGYEFQYMSEIAMFKIPGIGKICLNYIDSFKSEDLRACLIYPITLDKIKGADRKIMDLYYHFKNSYRYISPPDSPGPLHIMGAYDNAFLRLKSKKLVDELMSLTHSLRDVFYLPLTTKMIAKKWTPPELEKIMVHHLTNKSITRADVGLPESGAYYPSLETIVEQTKFTAIACLQYYPSQSNLELVESFKNDDYAELRKFSDKMAQVIKNKLIPGAETK